MKDSRRTVRATCAAAAAPVASSIAGKRLTNGHRSQHGTSQTVKLACGATAIASQGVGQQPCNDSITATMTTDDMFCGYN